MKKQGRSISLTHCPMPWKVAESIGGKVFMYDANGNPIVIPNMAQTHRTPQELAAIYRQIVAAVNSEAAAWENFDDEAGA